jgi:hypothetical protein
MYADATGPLAFGDIFSADWFFDAYLRRDAVPLVQFQTSGGANAWRRAAPAPDRDLVFAHGRQRAAVLLGDDCEIETILRRRGRSRLVFAAIEPLPQQRAAAQKELATTAFRRFPLPPQAHFGGGVVEFQELFSMSVDGVQAADDGVDPRILRLDAGARLELEMRWSAYATRRGPLTHLDNAEKFARLLTADGDAARLVRLHTREEDPTNEHAEIGRALIAALNIGWEIEGAVMNDMAEAYERSDPPPHARDAILTSLRRLASAAQRAAALIERS